jgi:hypothetical protein
MKILQTYDIAFELEEVSMQVRRCWRSMSIPLAGEEEDLQ